MTAPGWYALTLLALAALRTTRLLGWDTITSGARAWLTGYNDAGQRVRDGRWLRARKRGAAIQKWLHCPWCAGAWHAAAWWAAWTAWPTATLHVAAPLAISTIVGLVAKRLDT